MLSRCPLALGAFTLRAWPTLTISLSTPLALVMAAAMEWLLVSSMDVYVRLPMINTFATGYSTGVGATCLHTCPAGESCSHISQYLYMIHVLMYRLCLQRQQRAPMHA